jgi:hypothetical protein
LDINPKGKRIEERKLKMLMKLKLSTAADGIESARKSPTIDAPISLYIFQIPGFKY